MSGCRKQKKKYKFRQQRRRDVVTRMLVEIGIMYTSSLGLKRTSDFLRDKHVSEVIIHRVIKED